MANLYTLQEPVEAFVTASGPDEMWIPSLEVTLDKEEFDLQFMPLDVEAKKAEIREILVRVTGDAYVIGWANGKGKPAGQDLDDCRDKALDALMSVCGFMVSTVNKEDNNESSGFSAMKETT